MAYQRKTVDEWNVQGYFGSRHGWEDVAASDSRKEARVTLLEYRANDPQHAYRLKLKRVPRAQETQS